MKIFIYCFRFCVGDRFYLCENKILCEYDYEERLVFANMALHPPPIATLTQIKRQVTQLQAQVRFKQELNKRAFNFQSNDDFKSKTFNCCLNITEPTWIQKLLLLLLMN